MPGHGGAITRERKEVEGHYKRWARSIWEPVEREGRQQEQREERKEKTWGEIFRRRFRQSSIKNINFTSATTMSS